LGQAKVKVKHVSRSPFKRVGLLIAKVKVKQVGRSPFKRVGLA
jgi:hypothetical protein